MKSRSVAAPPRRALNAFSSTTDVTLRLAAEGQGLVVEHKGEAAIGVARCASYLQAALAEAHPIAVPQGQAHVLSADRCRQADRAAGGGIHQPAAGHMVGVDVGVERGDQIDGQFADQREIAAVLLEHRVDQHRLSRCRRRVMAAGPISDGAGDWGRSAAQDLLPAHPVQLSRTWALPASLPPAVLSHPHRW